MGIWATMSFKVITNKHPAKNHQIWQVNQQRWIWHRVHLSLKPPNWWYSDFDSYIPTFVLGNIRSKIEAFVSQWPPLFTSKSSQFRNHDTSWIPKDHNLPLRPRVAMTPTDTCQCHVLCYTSLLNYRNVFCASVKATEVAMLYNLTNLKQSCPNKWHPKWLGLLFFPETLAKGSFQREAANTHVHHQSSSSSSPPSTSTTTHLQSQYKIPTTLYWHVCRLTQLSNIAA